MFVTINYLASVAVFEKSEASSPGKFDRNIRIPICSTTEIHFRLAVFIVLSLR